MKQARLEHRFGARTATQIWRSGSPRSRHFARGADDSAYCSAILDSAGYRSRGQAAAPSNVRLFEKEQPGDCIQVDVKFVRVNAAALLPVHGTRRLHTVPAYFGSIDTSITGTAWRSSASSAPRCRFRSGSYIATTVPSFPPRLALTLQATGTSIATLRHVGPSKTAKSNGVTASTTRNSGSGIRLHRSTKRRPRSNLGSDATTRPLLDGVAWPYAV